MTDAVQELAERIKSLASDWGKYTVIGSFALYLLGYLVLRFHLSALGLATDLAVLDERYLFSGARFVVVLVASVPNVLLVLLLPALVAWLIWRALPPPARTRLCGWAGRPALLALAGIVFAVFAIQFVMRQCFGFYDLLLAEQLPPGWLRAVLFGAAPLYFEALMLLCIPPLAAALALRGRPLAPGLRALLWTLCAIQLLLLPVNYGILFADKSLARLAAIGEQPLGEGRQAWLVWEGKDGVTYLVRDQGRRSLLTLPRAETKRIEIVGFDSIFPVLYSADGSPR